VHADVDISKSGSRGPSRRHAGCVRLVLGDGFEVCHGQVRSIGLSQAAGKAQGHRQTRLAMTPRREWRRDVALISRVTINDVDLEVRHLVRHGISTHNP